MQKLYIKTINKGTACAHCIHFTKSQNSTAALGRVFRCMDFILKAVDKVVKVFIIHLANNFTHRYNCDLMALHNDPLQRECIAMVFYQLSGGIINRLVLEMVDRPDHREFFLESYLTSNSLDQFIWQSCPLNHTVIGMIGPCDSKFDVSLQVTSTIARSTLYLTVTMARHTPSAAKSTTKCAGSVVHATMMMMVMVMVMAMPTMLMMVTSMVMMMVAKVLNPTDTMTHMAPGPSSSQANMASTESHSMAIMATFD